MQERKKDTASEQVSTHFALPLQANSESLIIICAC